MSTPSAGRSGPPGVATIAERPPPSRPPPPEALLRPLARVLRPLVRLMIRSGVTFPLLSDLLRALYVEVAARDLLPGEAPRSDSRVAVLTGIHRKELRRQREAGGTEAAEPAVVTLNSQLLARWLGDPLLAGADGAPLPLPRAGDAPSFEALVLGATRDVRPRAVLDEWLAQGIASLDAAGRVRLDAAAFLPREDQDARLFYFARNLHDHVAAAAANVSLPASAPGAPPAAGLAGGAPFLDRSVHYDGLGLEAAAELERAARDAAVRLLLDVNRTALAIADRDDAQSGRTPEEAARADPAGADPAGVAQGRRPTRRVNLGVYLYVEDEPTADGSAGGTLTTTPADEPATAPTAAPTDEPADRAGAAAEALVAR